MRNWLRPVDWGGIALSALLRIHRDAPGEKSAKEIAAEALARIDRLLHEAPWTDDTSAPASAEPGHGATDAKG